MPLSPEWEEVQQHLQTALRVIQSERELRMQAEAALRQERAKVATLTSPEVRSVLALARQVEQTAREVGTAQEPEAPPAAVPP